jgi:hypothetical protein
LWLLNDQVSIAEYEDAGEFVLYAVEAGETLLLNEVGRKLIQWMHLHRYSPVSEEQLLQQLLAQEETETMECLQSQIQELMQELTKRHLVQRVEV